MNTSTSVVTIQGAILEYLQKPGDVWEIIDISVSKEVRRTGLGTKLVNILRKKKTTGVIHVFTRRTNGEARLFYQSLGMFELVVPGFYPDCDACLFVDKIRP